MTHEQEIAAHKFEEMCKSVGASLAMVFDCHKAADTDFIAEAIAEGQWERWPELHNTDATDGLHKIAERAVLEGFTHALEQDARVRCATPDLLTVCEALRNRLHAFRLQGQTSEADEALFANAKRAMDKARPALASVKGGGE